MVAKQYIRGQGVGHNWNTGHNLHEKPMAPFTNMV